MEPVVDLDPDRDDLPLRANTNHVRVRHYVLDLAVHLDSRVIGGNMVMFLEPVEVTGVGLGQTEKTLGRSRCGVGHADLTKTECDADALTEPAVDDVPRSGGDTAGVSRPTAEGRVTMTRSMVGLGGRTRSEPAVSGSAGAKPEDVSAARPSCSHSGGKSWESASGGDFILVLDCCDLNISKVEELDVTPVTSLSSLLEEVKDDWSRDPTCNISQSAALLQKLVSMPSASWRRQQQLFYECSCAPDSQGGSLEFHTDRWSLQVRKKGVVTPQEFPRALRVSYITKPEGRSVRWTKDQDNRVCVYTAGSPINNRALFPCQEPPVAMSTWQARVRAPSECVVLMSGENEAIPIKDEETGLLIWDYYVTMPMPASTFALAVGCWRRAAAELPTTSGRGWAAGSVRGGEPANNVAEAGPVSRHGSSTSQVIKGFQLYVGSGEPSARSNSPLYSRLEDECYTGNDYSARVDDGVSCSHGDYPCRFAERSAWSQRVVPHRVFAPACLLLKAQLGVLSLLPRCLAAAHAVLGVHPFPRLDVLIVPAGFSSLGMASPHLIFLSQSVLGAAGQVCGDTSGSLCGSRLCHELAHAWFGLAIGARDWTEEWISEGFATYLEDIVWAQAQQLSPGEASQQSELKALLRWRRLRDELQHSQEELQVLRPNMERTGEVSDGGSSVVKHALNPDKTFMQVHYLKGYFLLTFLASEVGGPKFLRFFQLFVMKYHGQLILSQDFLQMLLRTFPDMERKGLTLSAIYADWMDQPGIPKWLYERSSVWSQARLVKEVKAEVVKWTLLSRRQGKGRKRKRAEPKVNYKELTSDQLVLLLELLLEEKKLSVTTLQTLQACYDLQTQDAEVRHRWCELVVKHGHAQAYNDVELYLIHDQAMGVYLYGELMVHEKREQQTLAHKCLSLVQEEMDQSARRVVEEMVL